MQGNCLVTSKQSIDGVLAQTPRDKTAMFRVISAPSETPDRFLGEHVYVKKDKVFDFMTDSHVIGLRAEDLMFVAYV